MAMLPAGPGRPGVLRSMNDRAALGLLLANGPMTRAQISQATGLSGPTTAQLVVRLRAAGVIDQAGQRAPQRGPKAVTYRARTELARGIAIHMLPGVAEACVVDASLQEAPVAQIRLVGRRRSAAGDITTAMDAACGAAGLGHDGLVAVCVGVPSAVSPQGADLSFVGPLPGWSRRDVRSHLEDRLGMTVLLDNDANLAAVAEQHQRGDPGDFALLWQGEGLRIARVVDGTLQRGAGGGAGEIGYLPAPCTAVALDPQAPSLQDLAGSAAVTRLVRAHRPAVRTYEAALRALAEDAAREELLADLAARIGETLVPALAVLDPARVVLGGPTGAAGGADLARLVQAYLRRATRWRVPVAASAVTSHPVLRGAALTLAEHLAERLYGSIDRATTSSPT